MTQALFDEFISPECDRCAFIQSYLAAASVESVVLPIAGRHHIYVKFPMQQYNPQFRMKTCIAHYDRAPCTPGANDNSSAVAILMDWAVSLARGVLRGLDAYGALCGAGAFHNVRLLFTDGEEGVPGEGVRGQGAFDLAAIFKRLGITGEDVYVFDCVGRGTVPIIGQNAARRARKAYAKSVMDLEERAAQLLHSSAARYLCLPLPYSDNAGFIAQGIPAVCITMLPEDEADSYLAALMRDKGLAHFVMNRVLAAPEEEERYAPLLPRTWQIFHTERDTADTLTAESRVVMARILDTLGRSREVR